MTDVTKLYRYNNSNNTSFRRLEELGIKDPEMRDYVVRGLEGIIQNIQNVMESKGLNGKQLSKAIYTDPSYFAKAFSGRINLTLMTFLKFCYVLNIDPREMIPYDLCNDRLSCGDRFNLITEHESVKVKNDMLDINIAIMRLLNNIRSNEG